MGKHLTGNKRHSPIALEVAVSIAVESGENKAGFLVFWSHSRQQDHEGDGTKSIPEDRELVDQPQHLNWKQAE